jgi:hypothetical protein
MVRLPGVRILWQTGRTPRRSFTSGPFDAPVSSARADTALAGITGPLRGGRMSRLNIGNVDRALRVVAGIALVGLAASGAIGAWGYVGIALVLTGVVALCPLYSLLGIATTSR